MSGRGSAHLVEGPAGVGKTTVLGLFAEAAAERGVRVLRAQATPVEGGDAWAGVRRLFDAALIAGHEGGQQALLAGAAANARPALGLEPPGESVVDPFACVHGLYWLVANLATDAPLLLCIDDVQWIDEPSARWLVHMASRAADLPLVLVAARRAGEPAAAEDALADLAAVEPLNFLRPRPLSEEAAGRFLDETIAADVSADIATACHRATGGNPFLLAELCASLGDGGNDGMSPEAVAGFASEGVARSLRRRIDRLGPDTLAVASLLAVLGEGSDLAEITTILNMPPDAVAGAADALAAAGIVRVDDGLRFTHPLLGSSFYEWLEDGERSLRHREVAAALADTHADSSRVASHLMRAAPGGDPWVVDRLEEGAEAAARRGAGEVAAQYLKRALAEPPEPERIPRLRYRRALQELGSGDDGAIDRLSAAVAALGPDERPGAALEASRTLGLLTEHATALSICAAVAEEGGSPPEIASRIADEMAVNMLPLGPARWPDLDPEVVFSGAPDPPDEGAAALRQVTRALVAVKRGRPMDQAALLGAMPHLLGEAPSITFAAAGLALTWSDELEAARELVAAAMAQNRATGSAAGAAQWSSLGALGSLRAGRVVEGRAEAEASAEFNADQPAATRAWPVSSLVDTLVLQGDLEAAARAAGSCDRPDDFLSTALLTEACGRLALAQGNEAEAVRLFTDTGRRFDAMGYAGPPITQWRAWLAIALARSGDAVRGAELAREEQRLAKRSGSSRAVGFAALAAAVCAPARERLAALEAAVDLLRIERAPIELTRAQIELGAELRRQGRRRDAREPLSEAMETALACGATGLEQDARQELLATGARPRRRALAGPQALTPSELRVARLVAAGSTNREAAQALFLSEKTVEGHLRGIFRKLEISSRTEIAGALGAVPGTVASTVEG